MFKKVWKYKYSIICTLAILRLCLMPFPSSPDEVPLFPMVDKLVHIGLFGTLTLFLLWESSLYMRIKISRETIFDCALITFLFGGAIELMQKYFTVYRSGDWTDWLADAIGVLLAVLVFYYVQKYSRP